MSELFVAGARPRSQDRCFEIYPAIFNMSMLATGRTAFSLASGVMMRPALSLYFLMYTQIFFVTSVRGMVLPPQMAANAGLRVFGAKMPTPFFFMANAFFLPAAFMAFLPAVFFSAVIFFNVALVGFVFVFVTVVLAAVVLVVVVISIKERIKVHARLEP